MFFVRMPELAADNEQPVQLFATVNLKVTIRKIGSALRTETNIFQ